MIHTRQGFINKTLREIDGHFTREESIALKKQFLTVFELIDRRKKDQKIQKYNTQMMIIERKRDDEILKRLIEGDEVAPGLNALPAGEDEEVE